MNIVLLQHFFTCVQQLNKKGLQSWRTLNKSLTGLTQIWANNSHWYVKITQITKNQRPIYFLDHPSTPTPFPSQNWWVGNIVLGIMSCFFYPFPYILSISYAFSLSIQLEFSSYFWISIHHMECPEGPNIPIIRPSPFTQKLLSISSEYRPQRRFNQVAHTFKRVFLTQSPLGTRRQIPG